ncbi:carboxylesterase/lipase family protein [Seonamhaeicola maritimus]|uniref:carboxylesterase/lipase family protein n=1 Tax=Seonamhaeicola maritimus TaxID=2591822 RepID=UPI002494913F|nr:carboxylesterase family protein [Seonamhaeicola maritimus]
MNKSFVLFFSLITIISCKNNTLAQNPLQKQIESGIIEGALSQQDEQVEKYLGIPYAQPPIGDLRWKAPQKPIPWQGVLKTQQFSKKAMQSLDKPWNTMDKLSEDCLYLNVWKPADIGDEKLPVLVLIHGGGLKEGGTRGPELDGTNMAKKGIVVVSANYRLNIFGFLAHPELSAETSYKGSGNYGFMDQQFALQWVKNNIEVFGGDPNSITLAGESAGARSVHTLTTSPLSKDLMVGAIASSGGINPVLSMKAAEDTGVLTLEKLGYNTIAELRKASTEDIIKIYKNPKFLRAYQPTLDNYVISKEVTDIYKAKEQANIPLLIGWNSSEYPGELFLKGANYSKDHFINRVKEVFPEHYEKILEMYPHETEDEVKWSATQLTSTRSMLKGWKWFDLHRKHSDQTVFRYLFGKIPPPPKTVDLSTYTPPLGPSHAREIPYFWGNLRRVTAYNFSEDDYKVSAIMQEYLSNFIKTGNPNGKGLPEWPSVKPNSESPIIMNIDTETKLMPASNDFRLRYMNNEGIIYKSYVVRK